jgi:hypothetical protein
LRSISSWIENISPIRGVPKDWYIITDNLKKHLPIHLIRYTMFNLLKVVISKIICHSTWRGRCYSLRLLFNLNFSHQKASTNTSGWVDVIPSEFCSNKIIYPYKWMGRWYHTFQIYERGQVLANVLWFKVIRAKCYCNSLNHVL